MTKPASFLIDTGSSISLIKRKFLSPKTAVAKNSSIRLQGASHEILETLFHARIHYKDQLHIVHVIRDDFPIVDDGILGIDFLKSYGISWNIASTGEKLILAGSEYTLHPSTLARIPPTSIQYINVPTDMPNGTGIIEEFDALVDVKDNTARVALINENREELRIPYKVYHCENLEYEIVQVAQVTEKCQHRLKLLSENTRLSHVPRPEREKLWEIISAYEDIFLLPEDALPPTKLTYHSINTSDETPIHVKQYRYPPIHKEEIEKQMRELLVKGIIQPSDSPYNFPLWVVPKKTDASGKTKWRVVVDFRKLNEKTQQDAYPLPNIDEILDQLGGARYFSAFDLASGFHQIPLNTEHTKKTAFSTPNGHYEYRRMPFGLKNAPATFQRMMDNALRGLINQTCFVYLDDIIVYGKTLDEHNKKLQTLFQRLREVGLKLQTDKCEYLRPELTYLGHVITEDGVKPNPEKIKTIRDFPTPKNPKHIKQFLGLVGYYRKFIKNFSRIAKPLTTLLKKSVEWKWEQPQEAAFQTLRETLITEPILQYPNFRLPFILTTDASNKAIGAVLSQGQAGTDLPVAYASRTLNSAEINYSTTEKELLAIVWACKHFRPYLYGRKFKIITDHKPLVWLMNVKNPNSRLMRWRLQLEEYEYEIEYKKGKTNGNADALSRIFPIRTPTPDIMQLLEDDADDEDDRPQCDVQLPEDYALEFSLHQNLQFDHYEGQEKKPLAALSHISKHPLKPHTAVILTETDKLQFADNCWKVPNSLNNRNKLEELFNNIQRIRLAEEEKGTANILITHQELSKSEKKDLYNLLEYIFRDSNITINAITEERVRIDHKKLIRETHESPVAGHSGITKTLSKTREAAPEIRRREVIEQISNCQSCKRNKEERVKPRQELLITDTPTESHQKIAIDLIGPFPTTTKGNRYAMTVQDQLTKFISLIPLPDTTARTLAERLVKEFLSTYGFPEEILSDNQHNIGGKLMTELEKILGIKPIRTTTYRPQSNGSLERAHHTIKEYLRHYVNQNWTDWDEFIKLAALSYNTATHEATGFSPYELTFGKKPNLPNSFKTPKLGTTGEEYLRQLKNHLESQLKRARENILRAKEKHKAIYDDKIIRRVPSYQVGDTVYLINQGRRVKTDPPYIGPFPIVEIISRHNVKVLIKNNRTEIVHIDRLRLANPLPDAPDMDPDPPGDHGKQRPNNSGN